MFYINLKFTIFDLLQYINVNNLNINIIHALIDHLITLQVKNNRLYIGLYGIYKLFFL